MNARSKVGAETTVQLVRILAPRLREPEDGRTAAGISLGKPENSPWFPLHAIYDRMVVAGPEIVAVPLTPAAYAHGSALALPEEAAMARPTGVGRALATYRIPIEGRDEWLAAARWLA